MKPGKIEKEDVPQGYRRFTMPGDPGGHSEQGQYNYLRPLDVAKHGDKFVYSIDVTDEDLEQLRESKRLILQLFGPVQFSIDPWVP